MLALDRAKRVQAALTKLVERRERVVQRAGAEFRLDLLAAIDQVDDETMSLVQRGLAMDRAEQGLQYALQLAIDERNEARRVSTRRSGSMPVQSPLDVTFDPHEAETDAPPPLPDSFELGDEDDLSGLDAPAPGMVRALLENGETVTLPGGIRYPEPGEPAVTLADGTVIAAP